MNQRTETAEEHKQAEALYHRLLEQYPHEEEMITMWWEESPTLRMMRDAEAGLSFFG